MENPYLGESWLGSPPEISEKDITETLEADVVIVGAGLAGVAAARQAAEMGAETLLFEKCETIQARSGDFAVMDSRVADAWRRGIIDKAAIVENLARDMAYKVSLEILKRWADEAGRAFDWYLEGIPDAPLMKTTLEIKPKGAKVYLEPRRFPLPDSFNNDEERFKCYQVTVSVLPTHRPLHKASYEIALATGKLRAFFNAPACVLLRKGNGPVTGLIARSDKGFVRALARKGVILATGDIMSDDAMLRRFAPGNLDTPQLWTSYDREKRPSNTGDGHRMGLWAGARMQDWPAAPMAHHMGSVFGCNGFLLLNSAGKRFTNEDLPGQQLGSQIELLPDKKAWQFVDGDWAKYLKNGYPSHGSVCYPLSDEEMSGLAPGLVTNDNVVNPAIIEHALKRNKLFKADSLGELVKHTGLPEGTAMAEIERYNAMCDAGKDNDFNKTPHRLWPVRKPPFFAASFTPATMIAVVVGLKSDADCRCYGGDGKPVKGLYVAGNVQGDRCAVDYPLTVPGLSHSMALTFGRIAAKSAVKGV
jgi:succinate dehydrogenase/fumarate reductase flavoprotein subunit